MGASLPGLASGERVPDPVHDALTEAGDLLVAGDANAAILLLETLRLEFPDDARVFELLGETYSVLGVWESAEEFFEQAIALDAARSTSWTGLGIVRLETQRSDAAREAFVQALRLDPRDGQALGYLGEMALQRGDTDTALAYFRRILDNEGETLDALTNLAVIHQRRNEDEEATRLLQRAVELYPGQPSVHYHLAVQLAQEGDFHEAVIGANRALELDGEYLDALRFLGVLYFERQACRDAIRYFDRVLRLSPMDEETRIGLASCLHLAGDTDRAVLELKTLMNSHGEDYDLLLLVSNFRLEQGDLDEALEMAIRAAALQPSRPDAHYLLGLAYQRLGLEDEALEEFRVLDEIRERERRGVESAATPDPASDDSR